VIFVFGLSHKTAPIEVREKLAIRAEDLPAAVAQLARRPEVREIMVLSTCNRVEVFGAARPGRDRDASRAAAAIEAALRARLDPSLAAQLDRYVYRYEGDAAVRHMFRVASSLDSLVVGEPQILGQLRDAYEVATAAGTIGTLLGRAVETALHAGKRVRTETQIGAGTVSVSSVAVELADQIFGELTGRLVALLGAGEMAEAAAKHLCAAGARLVVVNRSAERGAVLARSFGATSRPWDALRDTLLEADVVLCSTASQGYVLGRELIASVERARRGRSLFLIDIAVPRNVDPAANELDGVYLYDIDDLSKIAAETVRERASEATRAEAIVDEEAEAFAAWLDGLSVTPTIVALRSRVQQLLSAELQRSLGGKLKHLGEQERKALEDMMAAALNKLTHAPSTRLKAAAAEGSAADLVESLRHLFDLGEQGASGSVRPPARSDPGNDAAPERASARRDPNDGTDGSGVEGAARAKAEGDGSRTEQTR
jgi:glutamyl-tRNA reductase